MTEGKDKKQLLWREKEGIAEFPLRLEKDSVQKQKPSFSMTQEKKEKGVDAELAQLGRNGRYLFRKWQSGFRKKTKSCSGCLAMEKTRGKGVTRLPARGLLPNAGCQEIFS